MLPLYKNQKRKGGVLHRTRGLKKNREQKTLFLLSLFFFVASDCGIVYYGSIGTDRRSIRIYKIGIRGVRREKILDLIYDLGNGMLGFHNVIACTELESFFDVIVNGKHRENNDRHMARQRRLFDLFKNLIAVFLRHQNIEKHQIRLFIPDKVDALFAINRFHNSKTSIRKFFGYDFREYVIVFDESNFFHYGIFVYPLVYSSLKGVSIERLPQSPREIFRNRRWTQYRPCSDRHDAVLRGRPIPTKQEKCSSQ